MNKKILVLSGIAISLALLCIILYMFGGKKEEFVVRFDSLGGTIVESQTIKEGGKIDKPVNPTKEGYEFVGWEYNGIIFDFENVINENVTLVAKWEIKEEINETPGKVKVTFDIGERLIIYSVKKGNKVKKPADPEKKGYKFIEWQLDGETYDFETEVIENITLIAKYEEVKIKSYTVTFNSNGGSTVVNQTVKEGNKANKPADPTRSGYTFSGWTLNGVGYNFNSTVNSNITLVATWTKVQQQVPQQPIPQQPKNYTVTFDTNGGSAVANQTVKEGNKVAKPTDPTRSGYTFSGWTLNGTSYDFNSVVKSNITLVAKWTEVPQQPKNYTVTFDTNGGSAVANQTVKEGSKVAKPTDPTRSGYVFSGWTLNGTNYDFNSAVNSDITLVAKWTENSYTIKATPVDQFSPDRILSVYENGNIVTIKKIMYSDGLLLCDGTNPTVSMGDITGEVNFKVELIDGRIVNAILN